MQETGIGTMHGSAYKFFHILTLRKTLLGNVMKKEIIFLGSGGGGENLARHLRGTGGFRINGAARIQVDPGPGAVSEGKKHKQKPGSLDAIIVTHKHIDHKHDLPLLIDIATWGKENAGFELICSESICPSNAPPLIDEYYLGKVSKLTVAHPGDRIKIIGKKGWADLIATPTQHQDGTCFGFVLQLADGMRIGYTSDTEYFDGIAKHYAKCNVLIVNTMKPDASGGLSGHLFSETAAKLLKEAKPLLAVLTHFGVKMHIANPEKEAEKIEKIGGVRTIAAYDGLVLDLMNLAVR